MARTKGHCWNSLGNDTGTGNTVDIQSQVHSGMCMGSGLPYPCNTVPFSMGLRVPKYRSCDLVDQQQCSLLITLDTATSLPLTPTTTNQMGPNDDNLSSFGPQVSLLYVHYCICSNFFHLL